MKIEVNIEKQSAYLILGGILILAGLFSVYAFGGNTPSTFGHSLGEIDFSEQIPKINVSEICIGNNCQTSWPDTSPWEATETGINYNGNVSVDNSELASKYYVDTTTYDCNPVEVCSGYSINYIDGGRYSADCRGYITVCAP